MIWMVTKLLLRRHTNCKFLEPSSSDVCHQCDTIKVETTKLARLVKKFGHATHEPSQIGTLPAGLTCPLLYQCQVIAVNTFDSGFRLSRLVDSRCIAIVTAKVLRNSRFAVPFRTGTSESDGTFRAAPQNLEASRAQHVDCPSR